MEIFFTQFQIICYIIKLKSDRFGMEIVYLTNSEQNNNDLLLKSDRFGMEIFGRWLFLESNKELVKIRPFRYGNFLKGKTYLSYFEKRLKSDRFGMEIHDSKQLPF